MRAKWTSSTGTGPMHRIIKNLDYISNINGSLEKVFTGMDSIIYVHHSKYSVDKILNPQR